jgi:hypothetical protein
LFVALLPLAADQAAQLSVRRLVGGLSNILYKIESLCEDVKPRCLVLREFCSSNGLVDRAYEENVFVFLAEVQARFVCVDGRR